MDAAEPRELFSIEEPIVGVTAEAIDEPAVKMSPSPRGLSDSVVVPISILAAEEYVSVGFERILKPAKDRPAYLLRRDSREDVSAKHEIILS